VEKTNYQLYAVTPDKENKMNNMYDILGKMNLLEGRGAKPDFLDLDKDGNRKEKMKDAAKEVDEGSTGDYSAKKARAGKDIGKPGKAFATIAAKAGKSYGSKAAGERVAGAVLNKLRHPKEDINEGVYTDSQTGKDYEVVSMNMNGDWEVREVGSDKYAPAKIIKKAMQSRFTPKQATPEGNAFTGKLKSTPKGGSFKLGDKEFTDTSNLEELDMKLLKGLQGAMSKNQKDPESERNIHKKYGYRSDRDDTGNDDDYDEHGNLKDKKKAKHKADGPKKKGRPAGTGRKLGAKGPTGKSKLLRMKEDDDLISLVDKGEYDREGDMAKDDLESLAMAAKELHGILGDDENLPEWVQSKITKALDYINSSNQYMHQQKHDQEEPVAEKAVSRQQQKFMGMAHAMQKGEKIKGASPELKKVAKTMKKGDVEDFAKTKHKGLPEKKKKEEAVDETTVAGSVAPAPAGGKGKKGMVFGKGIYESQIAESFEKKLGMLTEGMSINMSMGPEGEKSLTVTASDEDAVKLAQILKLAGLGASGGYEETCSACGQSDCGCEQMEEDYSNSPETETQSTEYMTKTIAGGLNKNKTTGMTTIPVVPTQQVTEAEVENHLMKLYQQYKTV
jgi:hypothetical protein